MSRGLATRVDTDDIVQSVFRRFFHAASHGRYRAPSGEDLGNLLAAITRNRLKSEEVFHRAAKRDLRHTVGGDGLLNVAGSPRSAGSEDHPTAAVDELLALLPPQHREAVAQRMEGFEVAEIAARLGRSKRTVERILQEARQRLQIHFEDSADDPQPRGTDP